MPFGRNRGDSWGSQKNLHDRDPTDSLSNHDISEISEECEDYGRNCPWWYKKNGGSKIIPKSLLPNSGKRRSKSTKRSKSAKRVKTAKRTKSRRTRRQRK